MLKYGGREGEKINTPSGEAGWMEKGETKMYTRV
jgi:hypothetical protein